MAILNTTGSSLSANTYEQAIEELSTLIAIAQKDSSKNPNAIVGVSFVTDAQSGQTNYDFNIPLSVNATTNSRAFSANNYLSGITYTPGGALTGGNPVQDLVNLLFDIQGFENNVQRNPGNENRLSLDISSEPWSLKASLVLNTEMQLTGGRRLYTAAPYLS